MIDKNYNKKFQDFFTKFEKQYFDSNDDEKKFLFDLAINYVEKNRDFVMQYPIIQYWDEVNKSKIDTKKLISWYSNKEINLYFHIPFCKTRCTYCSFYIVIWDKQKELYTKMYFKKLKDEVLDFLEHNKNFKIKTIFIWGWTPSYLQEDELWDFLDFINTNLWCFFNKDIEFSFEWNPDSFNEKKLEILKKNWVNRLSIWVQTFDDNILKKVNRTYTGKTVYNIINTARKVGFWNINVDILYWLPWHNYEIMKQDLEKVSKLDVEHITYYPLYYYKESTLSKIWEARDNIWEIYNFYNEIIQKLEKNWFKQYWREYFGKTKIHNYQNNFVSNWILYWFWLSAYSFNWENAFVKEQNLNTYLLNKQNIVKYIEYNDELLDKRLFVLGSRNIKISKDTIKQLAYIQKIIKLPLNLWLIEEKEKYFILTQKWLKYQEILAHMFL